MYERLVDRSPRLTADDLAARFVPPPRFADVSFASFVPNSDHPSQAAALAELEAFAGELTPAAGSKPARAAGGGLFRRRPVLPPTAPDRARPPRRQEQGQQPTGRYLDGGFGVGKTHLLASVWHAASGPKSFLTFEELTAFIGFVGMDTAIRSFSGHRVICIDEFELDDVANTRMAVTFLRAVVARGTHVVATSNAVPDRLGEGRFNAAEFTRELQSIASHFEMVRIDGPDFRALANPVDAAMLSPGEVEAFAKRSHGRATAVPASTPTPAPTATTTLDDFRDLLAHRRSVHPVHYGALIDGVDSVVLTAVEPIESQDAALLFVQLLDEVYDAGIRFAATGCQVGDLFPVGYRRGAYRKKYGRCESRLGALLAEARAATSPLT